jgi:hypothetical protein
MPLQLKCSGDGMTPLSQFLGNDMPPQVQFLGDDMPTQSRCPT